MTTTHKGKPYTPKATPKATRSLRKDYAVPTRNTLHYIRFWTSSRPVVNNATYGSWNSVVFAWVHEPCDAVMARLRLFI